MMEERIEPLARAMYESWGDGIAPWDSLSQRMREPFRVYARTAVAELSKDFAFVPAEVFPDVKAVVEDAYAAASVAYQETQIGTITHDEFGVPIEEPKPDDEVKPEPEAPSDEKLTVARLSKIAVSLASVRVE